jgi:ketosteroid isomerase-like protein
MRFLLTALLAIGCAHASGDVASLMKADRDFNDDVAKRGLDAWVEAFADDGAMFVNGAPIIRGHAEIREAMDELRDGRLTIRWKPLGAQVSRDGTLGYTWGNGVIHSSRGDSKVKYVTVWREVDAMWKAAVDIGNNGFADQSAASVP